MTPIFLSLWMGCPAPAPTDASDPTDGSGVTDDRTTADTGASCTWPDPAPKPFTVAPGQLAACVGGLTTTEFETGVPGPLSVMVTEVGTSERPADCEPQIRDSTASDWVWFRGTDTKGRERVFGWWFAEPSTPPAVGTTVRVELDILENRYVGTQEQELAVFDDQGAVVVHAQVGWYAHLFRSSLTLTPTTERGQGRDDCARWTYRDVLVNGVAVPYGGTTTVGDLRVVHGGMAVIEDQFDLHTCKKQCEWWQYPVSAMGAYRPAPPE